MCARLEELVILGKEERRTLPAEELSSATKGSPGLLSVGEEIF